MLGNSERYLLLRLAAPSSTSRMQNSIERVVKAVLPRAIVNAAAYTAVDMAESEPERAFAVNREGAGRLAATARLFRIPFVHVSTDYVFDGRKATIFAYQVRDPERYGVVSFDDDGRATGIVEKPKNAASNWAVTGLYFYDKDVVRYAAKVKPSSRGELEITDLNMRYLDAGTLEVARMGRGFAWLDTGTFESLIDAAFFVQTLEQRQGMKIACPEEIAYRMGFIDRTRLLELADFPYEEWVWGLSCRLGRDDGA